MHVDVNVSISLMSPCPDNYVFVDCLCKHLTWLMSLCTNNSVVALLFLMICPGLIMVSVYMIVFEYVLVLLFDCCCIIFLSLL